MNYKKILSAALALIMSITLFSAASAKEKPVMEIYFDSDNYSKGDIVAADIIVYNTTYNVLGFSLEYGENITVVDENGDKSDNGAALVKIHDELYRGEGIYSVLTADVTEENIKSIVYVNPNTTSTDVKNNSVTVGNEGRKVATLYFEMASDGVPDVSFAIIPGDTEFDSSAFFMLDDGKNPEGSVSKITYRKEEKPLKPEEPQKDDKKEENEKVATVLPKEPEEDADINTVVPDSAPPVIMGEDADKTDTLPEPDTGESNTGYDVPEDEKQDDISPLERAVGIGILGFAFGIAGAIVFKKIMDGVRNED